MKSHSFIARLASLPILLAIVVDVIASNDVLAQDVTEADEVSVIYAVSGVDSHLSQVLTTVQAESTLNLSKCSNSESIPDLTETVSSLLAGDELQDKYLKTLRDRLDQSERNAIIKWINSEAGISLLKAEQASKDMDETEYTQMQMVYEKSDANTDERSARIAKMLKLTGTVYFISAINTGISNLVTVASACTHSDEELELIDAAIKKAYGDEALYRSFMRGSLVLPASALYRDVSDEHIDAYGLFARSDAGKAYFRALINGVSSVLDDQVEALKRVLNAK